MSDGIFFSGDSLAALSRDVLAAAADLEVEAAPSLESVGRGIEERARQIAGDAGSTSIPPTVTGGLHGPLEYRVQAGSADAPLAGLWELGNKGGSRNAPTFRHPTFGKEPWQDQPRHRFLQPALTADRRHITATMEETWDRALRPHRLPTEVV